MTGREGVVVLTLQLTLGVLSYPDIFYSVQNGSFCKVYFFLLVFVCWLVGWLVWGCGFFPLFFFSTR